MPTVNIKTTLRSEYFDRPPKIRISVDSFLVFDGEVKDTVDIDCNAEYSEDQEHVVIAFELYGKESSDTQLDHTMQVVGDQLVFIESLLIEDCDIGENLHKIGTYVHDFNGTGDRVTQSWAQCMGCNGRQEIVMTNPLPLWLLENLP